MCMKCGPHWERCRNDVLLLRYNYGLIKEPCLTTDDDVMCNVRRLNYLELPAGKSTQTIARVHEH